MMMLHQMVGAGTPLHSNKHYMESMPYGERIMAGGLVIALTAAGWANCQLYHKLAEMGLRWKAALGIESKFRNPVFPGDTLYGVYTIQSVRASGSMPGFGIMAVGMRTENQK